MTESHDRTAADLDGHRTRRGRLIGREAETEEVVTLLAAARSGRGGTVFVTGEPGVGRTRFAAEATAVAAVAGMATAQGRAGTVGPVVPYRPLAEALLSLARAGLLPDLDELGRYGPVLAPLLAGTRDTGAGSASYLVIAEAVLRLLAVVGRQRGCLLVLDDLHDADAGTLAIVEYLLDNIGQQPTALLLTVGREPCAAAELAARARQRGAAALLTLRPLDRADVRLLVATELGTTPAGVSREFVDRLATSSAGIPFVVQELVHSLTGQALDDNRTPSVPSTVADSVRRRAGRLGPRGVGFLSMAALFGQRFPPPVLQHAIGCDPSEASAILRAAVASHLVVPDRPRAQWYTFRYPLAAQALLDGLGPGERATYAGRAARALAELYPGLPGVWCVQAAELHGHAGDTGEAIALYCEAAQRAMGDGAVERAVELLIRAHLLVDPGTAPEPHAMVLEQLLDAVVCSARFDRVPTLTAGLEALCGAHDLPAPRRAGLHARLAEIAVLRGRPAEARRHLDLARWLLGPRPADAHAALVDVAAAHVELSGSAPDRLRTAAESARRAADAARRAGLPTVLCKALLVLGQLAWQRDERTAVTHFTRVCAIAHARRLPVLRVSAETYLSRVAARRGGLPGRVETARQEALRMGALPLAHETGSVLALDMVRRCRFEEAGDRIREGLADATRSGLGRTLPMLLLAEAVLYAHQGRRAEMQDALERLAPLVDAAPGVRSMSYGLARAFCSLLEERHDAAEQELAQAPAHDAEDPATAEFGLHGIVLLSGVLAGRTGRRHDAVLAEAGTRGTRWDRQFAGLAHAVLLGREGRSGEAAAAASAALEAGSIYPVARHLCVRLVARSAYEDGWGSPVDWLREAEEYFHGAGLRAVVLACRALLRGMGASVRQRRTGTEQVPPDLRRCGITVREFEVARLLAERIGNKDIAGRLHISPRTVEKHVASLLQKTGHPNRSAFASASRDLVM
ncbi:AAA family ATPase [Streptomyces sp. M2CJ-2]|uniref:LuxR family transcriptional regulator n=1 Tax=Streptomyces sp. M2CJ-2 TaxID=2803948 RepID=UPI0019259A93|nr:LuxR family transcriptional regulator [Streptomyces sp. M2CJ-2]MBL3667461.1 AAA family ATPase [Streptomyces sp. M2CJ-2]